jgi:hypothetical protein
MTLTADATASLLESKPGCAPGNCTKSLTKILRTATDGCHKATTQQAITFIF